MLMYKIPAIESVNNIKRKCDTVPTNSNDTMQINTLTSWQVVSGSNSLNGISSKPFLPNKMCIRDRSYYVSGDSMPPVKCADYTFSQLKSTVLNKNGDTVTATVAVEYLDSVTKMTQISQFELALKLVDGNWKIVG